jgi:hypothetical protein
MLKPRPQRKLILCECSQCIGKKQHVPRTTATRHRFDDLSRTLEAMEQLASKQVEEATAYTAHPAQNNPGTSDCSGSGSEDSDNEDNYKDVVNEGMARLCSLSRQISLAEKTFLSSTDLVFLSSFPLSPHDGPPPLDPLHPVNQKILDQRLQLDVLQGTLTGIELAASPPLIRVAKHLQKDIASLRDKVEGWVRNDWTSKELRRKNADIIRSHPRPVVETGKPSIGVVNIC